MTTLLDRASEAGELRTLAPTVDAAAVPARLSGLLRLWSWDADDTERLAQQQCDRWLSAVGEDRDEARRLASRLGGEVTVLRRLIGELEHALRSVEEPARADRDEVEAA